MKYFLFLLFLISQVSIGQITDAKLNADVHKKKLGIANYGIVGEDDEYFYSLTNQSKKDSKREYQINQYNKKTLATAYSGSVTAALSNQKGILFHSIKTIAGQSYFFQVKQEKDGSAVVFSQKFDKQCKLSDEVVYLDTIPNLEDAANPYSYATDKISILVSEDQSKFAIKKNNYFDEGSQTIAYKVFNKDQNAIGTSTAKVPNHRKNFIELACVFQNNGDLVLLGMHHNGRDTGVFTSNPMVELYVLDLKKGAVKTTRIKSKRGKVMSASLCVDSKRNLVIISGVTAKSWERYNSAFTVHYDLSTNALKPINEKALTEAVFPAVQKYKRVSPINEYHVQKVLLKSNGESVMMLEKQHIIKSHEMGSQIIYTSHYARDIYVINSTSVGKITWMSLIPKNSMPDYPNTLRAQFMVTVKKNKTYLVFSDIKENSKSMTKFVIKPAIFKLSDCVSVMVTIDARGKMKKSVLFKGKQSKVVVQPMQSVYGAKSDQFLLFGCNGLMGRKYQYGRVNIK
ncbi:MAG: hypothetical protein ACJA0Q_000731 [Saprospiraceae bacterium]|jgi:hypothetical protein